MGNKFRVSFILNKFLIVRQVILVCVLGICEWLCHGTSFFVQNFWNFCFLPGITGTSQLRIRDCGDVYPMQYTSISFSFTRKDMVSTMKTKSSIQIEDQTIQVDPILLFQRLILLVGKAGEEISEAFIYELSALPASSFDKDGSRGRIPIRLHFSAPNGMFRMCGMCGMSKQ